MFDIEFEEEFATLYKRQLAGASGQRREMLERDLSNTKKMLEVLYPAIGSLKDVELECEMVSLSGTRIYGDAFLRSGDGARGRKLYYPRGANHRQEIRL